MCGVPKHRLETYLDMLTDRGFDVVVSAFERYNIGDIISETHNVNQRFCEINIVCNSVLELQQTADWIYDHLSIYDDNGTNMIVSKIENSFFEKHHASRG